LVLAGTGAAVVLLSPPVDAVADTNQIVHMIQHVGLLSIAGPLLGAGLPRRGRGLASVATAAVVLPAIVITWHAPALYDAAVRHPVVHALEHLAFLGAAVALWRCVVAPLRGEHLIAVFVAGLPIAALGLGMTFSATRWYSAYDAPLRDQQIAGAVMWGGGGAMAVIAAVALFYAWLRSDSPATRSEQSFHASAPNATGSTSSATRSVQTTGSIDTPSRWA
jgi:cytochrome c oxidase assembly factor CtaG